MTTHKNTAWGDKILDSICQEFVDLPHFRYLNMLNMLEYLSDKTDAPEPSQVKVVSEDVMFIHFSEIEEYFTHELALGKNVLSVYRLTEGPTFLHKPIVDIIQVINTKAGYGGACNINEYFRGIL